MDIMEGQQKDARIAELERKLSAALGAVDFWQTAHEQAEAALDSFLGPDGGKTVIELRSALAERERMLQLLWQHDGHFIADLDYDDWYDDLRARADKP